MTTDLIRAAEAVLEQHDANESYGHDVAGWSDALNRLRTALAAAKSEAPVPRAEVEPVACYRTPGRDALEPVPPTPPPPARGYCGWKESPEAMQQAHANANEWLWWFVRRDTPGASGHLFDYLDDYSKRAAAATTQGGAS